MGGYNKEELLNLLEGMMDELKQLERLLESKNRKRRADIHIHEQNVIKLESDLFRLEKSLIPTSHSDRTVIGRSAALKLELG